MIKLFYPVEPPHVTQHYGVQAPWYSDYHRGTDFRVTDSYTIMAAGSGKVVEVAADGEDWFELKEGKFVRTKHYKKSGTTFGNYIIIDHGGYFTLYAHLSLVYVQLDQTVKTGQVIGKGGNTGHSFGDHLHFELRMGKNERKSAVNAYPYFSKTNVSSWAVEAQKWNVDNKISDGERPHDNVTREEMWTMLHRMFKKD